MQDLRNELDNKELNQIRQDISQALHSADGYDNRLKLTVALQTILNEASSMLAGVDASAFLSDVRKMTDEMIAKAERTQADFNSHLALNAGVSVDVAVQSPLKAAELESEIREKLTAYDTLLRQIIESRQEMPMELKVKS